VSIVIACCWLWDDVATVFAIMAAFFLHLYLRVVCNLGADYYIGVPIVELMCLLVLRFLVSNYWNVWISFSANIIALLLHVLAINIQRDGVDVNVAGLLAFLVILAALPILLLVISFLLDDTT
jgi:hypothetical protein